MADSQAQFCDEAPRTRILVFGQTKNFDGWSVLSFDSNLQNEERIADMEPRFVATYSAVGESIYVIGGSDHSHETSRVSEFLVRERRWRERAPLAVGRNGHAAAVVRVGAKDEEAGGEKTLIGVFGGSNSSKYLSSCEIYDVKQDRWHKLPDMLVKRQAPAAACLPGDSRVFVFGGLRDACDPNASVEFCQLGADWQEKATTANTAHFWLPVAPMRTARWGLAATPFRGRILVAGGLNDYKVMNSVEMFSPPDARCQRGQWTELTGSNQSQFVSTFLAAIYSDMYSITDMLSPPDARNDPWTELAGMKKPRGWLKLVATDDAVFALGNYVGCDNSVEAFTAPDSSSKSGSDLRFWVWSLKKPLETLAVIRGAITIRI